MSKKKTTRQFESELLDENYGLVNKIVSRYSIKNGVIDYEDLKQAGLLGLLKAIRTYDSSKSKFSTYAWYCINNSIRDELTKFNQKQYNETELNVEPQKKYEGDFWELIPNLNEQDTKIVYYRLIGYTLSEISEHFNCSAENIRKKLKSITKKIKEANN